MATLVSRVAGVPLDGVGRVTVRTTSASSVRLKVGTDSGVSSGVIFGSSVTPNTQGDSQLTVSGLAAATQYYYRIEMTDSGGGGAQLDTGSVGKFRTAPAANTAASFAFDFGSCATGESASMAAIAARNDDLFFHLGDLYYHDASGTDIANFRTRMSARIQLTNHQSLFSTMPTTYTPSDHDGMNNNGTYGSDPTAWTNWNQVYREMFPTPSLAGTMGVYYTFAWGRIRFIHIDTRSFKSNPADTDNSSKTCLGTTQKQWLKDQITNATEPVIVILQDSPWIGSASAGDDAWLGYTTERSELATFFQNSGRNIGMLAGDMHAVAADDGTNAPGGIFVFHASPFSGTSSIKGGPYSVSPYPTSAGVAADQYGRVVVTDSSNQISLTFTGYSSDNTARVSLTKTFTVSPPNSAPPTPTGLAATAASTSQIDVSWNSAATATGYDLEVDGVVVDKATSLTHQHTGLSASTNHDYRVRAKNTNGTSAWSSIVSATTQGSGGGYATITLTGSVILAEQATSSGSITVTVPTGATVGEVLVAQIASTGTATIVTPTGWTLISQANETSVSSAGFYRVVTGSESASYIWTGVGTSRSTGIMQRFAGVDTTTPLDVTAASATSGVTTSFVVPSITTVTAGAMLLNGIVMNASTTSQIVAPASMTVTALTTGTGRRTTLAYESRPTAGATGTRTWTNTPSGSIQYGGWTVALRPAITTPPTTPTGLTAAAASSSQIDVSWNSSSGATGYDLEEDGVVVDKATSLTHQHTGLSASTNHDYRVRAKNTNGTSAWSSIVSATTQGSGGGGITLTGSPSRVEQATGSSLVLTVPAGAQIGEVLVAQIASTTNAVVAPAGWTQIAQVNQAGPISSCGYYRVVTGSETASYTWTGTGSDRSTGIMQRFAGVDTTTPIDVTASTAGSTGVQTTLTIPSITTVTAGAMLLSGTTLYSSTTTVLVPPTGMTAIITTTGTGRRTTLAYESRPTTGATGTRTWTNSPVTALDYAGWIVALRPAAAVLATPTGLAAAAASSSQIDVSWNSVSGATGYDLEVDSVVIDKATSLTHQHTGLTANTSHNYRVRAKNASTTSAWSAVVSGTTNASGSALALRGIGTTFSSTATTSYVLSTHSSTVIGDLLVATMTIDELASLVTVTPPAGWTAAFTPLQSGGGSLTHAVYWRAAATAGAQNYTFTLSVAYKGSGNIATFSGADTTTPFAGSVTAQGTGNVSLSLSTPSADNCIIITGFAVNHDAITYTYSTPSGWTNDWTAAGQEANLFYHQPILQTTAAAASFTSTISPANAQRWIGWIAAIQPPLPPPTTPTGLTAVAASSSVINVSWNSSSGATGYDLEVDSVAVDKAASLTHQHTGLATSSGHLYRVRAKNGSGTSAWSSIVSTTTTSGSGGSTAITLTGTTTLVEQATSSGSITVTVPTGAIVGEVLITQIASSASTTISTPAGWIQITQANETGAPVSSGGYYRVVTGTESASYIWTNVGTGRSTGIMQRFAGVNTTTPLDVTAASATSVVTTTFNVPSITTVTAGAMLLNGVVLNASASSQIVPPASMTATVLTTGTGRRTTLAYETRATAGATGTRAWTNTPSSSLQYAGWTVALRPAPDITTVTDLWNGSALIRQRIERWNGTALADIVAETKAP